MRVPPLALALRALAVPRQALLILVWALRVEVMLIMKRPLPEMVAAVGAIVHASPPAVPHAQPLRLSPDDMLILRMTNAFYALIAADAPCLRRTLVAARLLRYRSPGVAVGVRRSRGASVSAVDAHAWLVVDGQALDAASGDFTALWFGREADGAV